MQAIPPHPRPPSPAGGGEGTKGSVMATSTVEMEVVPVAEPVPAHLEDAARLLEQALKSGSPEPEIAYMLALCYKKQGKAAEARGALRKIKAPDSNVFLQMGLLSLQEEQY